MKDQALTRVFGIRQPGQITCLLLQEENDHQASLEILELK